LRNRQRARRINTALLRRITRHLLEQMDVRQFELCIHLVEAGEMAELNGQFLGHEGSTDVITFDYDALECADSPALLSGGTRPAGSTTSRRTKSGDKSPHSKPLACEIFVSVPDAISQALGFKTTWQSEIVRYVIHGLLHLSGYDDLQPAARRKMKREENRLLRQIEKEFAVRHLDAGLKRHSALRTSHSALR
jgi:probable rRNA maturation factor